MKQLMCEDFLLSNETAKKLYHNYAKEMPIYDYHCHLSPKEIAEDKRYRNIAEIWLDNDHYKWRVMRSNGVIEEEITGNADNKVKFNKWVETIEECIGNSLYHWTHLELKRYFDVNEVLNTKTSDNIWNKCNDKLREDDFTVREIIKKSNVKVICTTDDPVDTLQYHKTIANDNTFDVRVLPTFRPDKAINIDKDTFGEWIVKLEKAVGYEIDNYNIFKKALTERINYFDSVGCKLSDHGLGVVEYSKTNNDEVKNIFKRYIDGKSITKEEIVKYKTDLITFLGKLYAEKNWTMQIHIGALRNNNTRMYKKLGADMGFDSINDAVFAENLSNILDDMDKEDKLPRTILYCLNPRDNDVLATMIGNFQSGDIKGKIQFGSGWWFNDQIDGIRKQLKSVANMSLLSRFVGMVTDSRSFLSYTRHEYFRRILCDLIGKWVENGEFPNDIDLLGNIIENICYYNAVEYFGIDL